MALRPAVTDGLPLTEICRYAKWARTVPVGNPHHIHILGDLKGAKVDCKTHGFVQVAACRWSFS